MLKEFPMRLRQKSRTNSNSNSNRIDFAGHSTDLSKAKKFAPTRDHDHANSITSRRNFSECETISVSFNRKNERKISSWSIEHNICPSRKGADTNSQLFALRTRQLLRRVVLISTEAQVTQYKDGVVDLVVTKVRTSTHKPVLVYSRRPKKSYSLG